MSGQSPANRRQGVLVLLFFAALATVSCGNAQHPAARDAPAAAHDGADDTRRHFDPGGKRLVTLFEPENSQVFVDEVRLAELHLTLRDLASFLESQPFVFAAFVHDDVRAAARAAPP